MSTLWLKFSDVPHHDPCRFVGITENTDRAHLKEFVDGGVEALKVIPFEGTTSKLDTHQSTLKAHFRANPPVSSVDARSETARLTGIEPSPTQVREFMRRARFVLNRPGTLAVYDTSSAVPARSGGPTLRGGPYAIHAVFDGKSGLRSPR